MTSEEGFCAPDLQSPGLCVDLKKSGPFLDVCLTHLPEPDWFGLTQNNKRECLIRLSEIFRAGAITLSQSAYYTFTRRFSENMRPNRNWQGKPATNSGSRHVPVVRRNAGHVTSAERAHISGAKMSSSFVRFSRSSPPKNLTNRRTNSPSLLHLSPVHLTTASTTSVHDSHLDISSILLTTRLSFADCVLISLPCCSFNPSLIIL